MAVMLRGLSVYDPSSVSAYLETEEGDVALYGFVAGEKIYYEQGEVFISLQMTSECVPTLLKLEGSDVRIRLASKGSDKEVLSWFDGHSGTLETYRVGLVGSEVPTALFKISEY